MFRVLKEAILNAVASVRSDVYSESAEKSIFNDDGWFRKGEQPTLVQQKHICDCEHHMLILCVDTARGRR
jgi:hypothetical protein